MEDFKKEIENLRETLCEIADDLLSFLDLCRVGVMQLLHLILVRLAEIG